jgi:aminomethyltransferase
MRARPSLTHFEQPLQQTHFHARTSALCRTHRWGAWAGYASVLSYEDTAMEYTAIRNAASALRPLPDDQVPHHGARCCGLCCNHLTVRNAAQRLDPGRRALHGRGATMTADLILDDGTLFRLGDEEFRLCCQERHLPWLLDSAFGFDVTWPDETDDVAALSLQGPTSAARSCGWRGST